MKILIYTSDYPSNIHPNRGVFVYNLVQKFVEHGHEVTVVSPRSFHRSWLKSEEVSSYGKEGAKVYRPVTISTSAIQIGKFNTHQIGAFSAVRALRRVVKKHQIAFDVIYVHFLSNGILAMKALHHLKKPVYVALGESNLFQRLSMLGDREVSKQLPRFKGFIVVGNQLKEQLMQLGVDERLIKLFPNAVNLDKFKPLESQMVRKQLNLGEQDKIVVFVGRFLPHKGPDRIIGALKRIDRNVKLILIGKGDLDLQYDGIVFKGVLPSYQVPLYLNAADIFVLPTQREGASNAILEAMACGLPIISSDIPEVRAQCSPTFSKLVDPMDVDALAQAISEILFDQKTLDEMSSQALIHSTKFNIDNRARAIEQFIEQP